MEKSIHTREHAAFLALLLEVRQESGMTQVELAKKLKLTQSLYSKMERGECRLDIIQLRRICQAIGLSLPQFTDRLESRLSKRK